MRYFKKNVTISNQKKIEESGSVKKKIWAVICLCGATICISGCTKTIELTEQEQDIIAEYAASALINYDEGYNSRFKEDALIEAKADAKKEQEQADKESVEPTKEAEKTDTPSTPEPTPTPTPVAETPTPVPVAETPAPASTTPPAQATQKPNRMSPYDIGKLFGIEGVEVNYNGFQALDMYPVMEAEQLGFTMEANQGAKLIVVKFELVNKLDEPKACNIVGQNIKFQMRFNGTDNVAVQKTLLTDDFASLNYILQPGERKTVVVISQVAAGYETTISSVDLITRIGGENTMINLQ